MAHVIINPVRVDARMGQLTTPLVRNMTRDIWTLAKRWPTAGNSALTYPKTGELARSLKYEVFPGVNPSGRIGTDKVYAKRVHDGGPPYIIRRRRKKQMVFRWKRFGGRIYKFKQVVHPHDKGSPYLTGPAQIVARRYRARYINNPTVI